MKTLLTIAAVIFSTTIFGQVPQAIKYQAVARDTHGTVLMNQQLNVRITIIDSANGGANAYSEIHKAGTNQFGLFHLNIGEGTVPAGMFSNIPWATGNKWIKIELDPTGGTTFSDMGTQPLMSVPYALFAGNSNAGGNGWELIGNAITNPAINFIGTTDSVDLKIRTNNKERMRVLSSGNVEIGYVNP